VVTRTREQASQLSRHLLERGAEVLEIPTIKIVPPKSKEGIVDALSGLTAYDWIVFTSPNGVSAFFDFFFKRFEDLREIGGVRIAAVGPATAAKLRELHLQVDLMPDEYVATKIVDALAKYESIENLRILLPRAEVANPELPGLLEDKGAIVDDIAFYQTVPETEDANGAAATLTEEGTDWITFASSSTVESFHARFDLPALLKKFPGIKTASIGLLLNRPARGNFYIGFRAADGIFVVADIRSGHNDFVAAAEVERCANRIDRSSEVTLPRTSRNVPADPAKAPVVFFE